MASSGSKERSKSAVPSGTVEATGFSEIRTKPITEPLFELNREFHHCGIVACHHCGFSKTFAQ